MSLEVITDISMNFSNGAGGHTASVTSALDVKSTDGRPALGVVNGAIGEKNLFSNADINNLLGRFICTSKTNSRTAVGTTSIRNYSDITSLALNSYLVLVRGINAPPVDKDSYYGPVPYFSEVSGSPLEPFPSLGIKEIDNKRILVAGKIYNYETAANFNGVKISLVYQDGDLVDDLCLNKDMVQKSYLEQPDLSQYDLKFGYTLTEYLEMLEAAGIKQSGLENVADSGKILFQTSGTLASVTGTIASYFGFYYFINPNSGDLEFIDSRIAAQLPVTDFTQATDENIVSATFTEDKFAPQDVNVYAGTTEKPTDKDSKSPAKDDRPRPIYFKKVDLLSFLDPQGIGNVEVYKALFGLFAQGASTDLFNKYVILLLFMKEINKELGNKKFDWVDFGTLYDETPLNTEKFKFSTDIIGGPNLAVYAGPDDQQGRRFLNKAGNLIDKDCAATNDTPKGYKNRITARCEYFNLASEDAGGNQRAIPMPSDVGDKGGLYEFFKLFFDFAGGFFCSNGYTKYKAERMSFQNTNNATVMGPYKGSDKIVNIEELNDLCTLIKRYGNVPVKTVTIRDIWNKTKDQAVGGSVNNYFFIGRRPWSKLFYDSEDNEPIPFKNMLNSMEITSLGTGTGEMFIGGSDDVFNDAALRKHIAFVARDSINKFENATTGKFGKKSLRLTYIRSKTPVNDYGEEGQEKKDNQLSGSSEANQKIAELFDRYDLKNYIIDAPKTNKYVPLNLSSASGSTTEMKALRGEANKDYLNILNTPLRSSQKSIYGLEIPSTFSLTINSFSISIGKDGITTTIGESSLKLIPPDKEFTITNGMEAIGRPLVNRRLRAAQRNYLGL